MDAKPRLLDRARDRIRLKHYSYRTQQQYVAWVRRFVLFHGKRRPVEKPRRLPVVLTPEEVRRLLSELDGVNYLIAALRRSGPAIATGPQGFQSLPPSGLK